MMRTSRPAMAGLPGAISSVPDGMAAAVLAAAGIIRLGRYTRFVSYSVMTGFLSESRPTSSAARSPT